MIYAADPPFLPVTESGQDLVHMFFDQKEVSHQLGMHMNDHVYSANINGCNLHWWLRCKDFYQALVAVFWVHKHEDP